MTNQAKGAWVFATVDFQAEPTVIGHLPEALAEVLSTAPFPRCAPPSLKLATDYGGLKIFGFGEYLCLASFAFQGRTDGFGRAIPSARIVVGPRAAFGWRERHLAGFREFLITTEDWPSHGIEALSERLETCLTDAATLKNDRALMCADPLTSIAFAEILAHIACGGKLAVAGNDPQKRFKFFDQLFFLLPHDLFDSQQWCTYADAMGTDREDLVGLASSLVPEKKSFMGLLKKRIGLAYREGPRMVDAVSGTTRGARNNSGKKTKFSRVYEEFLSGGILKPYPPKDSLSVVLKLIAAQSHNRHLDLEDLAGKISREDISELMHLVRRQGHGQR